MATCSTTVAAANVQPWTLRRLVHELRSVLAGKRELAPEATAVQRSAASRDHLGDLRVEDCSGWQPQNHGTRY
jgi:hypothetical protein